jgi:hypothetical protein
MSFFDSTVASVDPISLADPQFVQIQAAAGIALFMPLTGLLLWWYSREPYGLVLLPDGVLLAVGTMRCFVPWDVMERVALVKVRRLGLCLGIKVSRPSLCLGIQVTDLDRVQTAAWYWRLLKRAGAKTGWHCLWLLWGYTLPIRQVVSLVSAYLQQPEERPKIGTEAELADVRAALASTGLHEVELWSMRPSQS